MGKIMNKITASSQDYLETILELSKFDPNVRCIDVAEKLSVSRASVNRAVNLLKSQGLLEQERYSYITLTDKGILSAKAVTEKHKTLKKFLIEVIDVSVENAEIDACKIEHIISEETFKKLKKFLSNHKIT